MRKIQKPRKLRPLSFLKPKKLKRVPTKVQRALRTLMDSARALETTVEDTYYGAVEFRNDGQRMKGHHISGVRVNGQELYNLLNSGNPSNPPHLEILVNQDQGPGAYDTRVDVRNITQVTKVSFATRGRPRKPRTGVGA